MNVLITGTDRGIGLGLVRHLLQRTNARIVATCRNLDGANDLKELQKGSGEGRLITACLDTTKDEQFEDVKNQIRSQGIDCIDVLIGNAAISTEEHPHDHALTCRRDELLTVFNTNVGGNLKLLQTFSDMLCQSRLRLAFIVSSKLGSLNCASSEGGTTAYRISKAGLNMMSVLFAQDGKIQDEGCKVIVNHPGHVETYLGVTGGQHPQISVDESVNAIINLISAAAAIQKTQLCKCVPGGENAFKQMQFNPPVEEVLDSAHLQEFANILRSDNKVFVNYNGEILPW